MESSIFTEINLKKSMQTRTFGQDGRVDKHCTHLLPWPHQNYNLIIVQPLLSTTWRWAEQNSFNWGYKKEAASRLVGETEMENRLVPHLCVAIKNLEQYLSWGGPLRSKRAQPHTGLPNLEHWCQEEAFPHGSENQQGLSLGEMKIFCRSRHPLKWPKHRPTHKH